MCFVALNATIADGYMVETDPDNLIRVKICGGGHNDRFANLDISTGKFLDSIEDHQNSDDSTSCEYASLTHWTLNSATLKQDIILQVIPPSGGIQPKDVAFIYSTSPPLPARGPPALLWI